MYNSYFHFKQEPFRITPDPEFLYLSPSHKEALAAIIYGVNQRKGFIAIVGEVGVGKTTILRSFLAKADVANNKIIYIFNANLTFKGLLQTIFLNLGQPITTDDPTEMLNQLYQLLIQEYQRGTNVVVIIDEAQNMPVKTLENLRMLSNLETATDKLIQVVFSGQPEFEKLLENPALRQLRQRLAIKATIRPLSSVESIAYINHRLTKAAGSSVQVFADRAITQVAKIAAGIPRTINIICDNCLVTTYGYQKPKVELSVLREICFDLGLARPPLFQWRMAVLVLLLVSVSCLWLFARQPRFVEAKSSATSPLNAVIPLSSRAEPPASLVPLTVAREPEAAREDPATVKQAEVVKSRRLVRKGDTLANLVSQRYGTMNRELLQLVKQNNPGINNPNRIVEGQWITFPTRD